MKPRQIALVFVIALALALLALTTGCVSVPIPLGGEDSGKLGRIELTLSFKPNVSGAIDYLWSKQQPKPISSK